MSTLTLSKVQVHTGLHPTTKIQALRGDSAQKVNELLNHSHVNNHIFFLSEDEVGVNLHNHLAHHALTLFAMGASPEQIQRHHERNQLYQRGLPKAKQVLVDNLDDPAVFRSCLGKDNAYLSFIAFFDRKIAELGLREFLHTWVFGPSEQARTIFTALFYGYLHPLLSFGFGVEFDQPAILSEGLAQACGHRDHFLVPVFRASEELARSGRTQASSLVDCLDAARANTKVRNSSNIDFYRQVQEGQKFFISRDALRDGVIPQAGQDLIEIAARWQVSENELARKTAELANAAAYALCAAQRAPYENRFDFFTLHGLNTSVHFTAFLKSRALRAADVARLLEHLGRTIILLYVVIGCPELDVPYAVAHRPKTEAKSWEDLFHLATLHEDDGHLCKCIRALANAQEISAPYDNRAEFRLKQADFIPLAHSVIDSGSKNPMFMGHPLDWIRGAGWEEAWEQVPRRDQREN